MYTEWFSFLSNTCQAPKGFIYLKVSPDIAYQRIKKRNRLSEKKLTLAYLKQIDQKHDAFLQKKQDLCPSLQRVPVLTLSCDNEFETNEAELYKHLETIKAFFNETI